MPSLRKTAIPMLFLYGGNDRHVPTWLCVQRLAPLRPRVEVDWFPRGDHFLIDTVDGLTRATELVALREGSLGLD